jgi:GTP-binding protein HflX
VLSEIDAAKIPEIVIINKADIADPLTISRILRSERDAIVVSAETGEGFDELLARIDEALPGPSIRLTVEVPYQRGDLVSRIMKTGIVENQEHNEFGTVFTVRVEGDLAADLEDFVI